MKQRNWMVLLAFALVMVGCGVDENGLEGPLEDGGFEESFIDEAPPAATGKADELTIRWEVLDSIEIPTQRLQAETRRVLSTPGAFEDFFGISAPENVDFENQWVFFFTPGPEAPGLQAELDLVRYASSLRSLQIITKTTAWEGPCATGEGQIDSLLAVFSRPNLRPQSVRYYHVDHVQACPAENCIDSLKDQFASATDDLWYPSESDYPFEFVHLSGIHSMDDISPSLLADVAGIEAITPFEIREIEDFFSWIARPESAEMDSWEREETARFRNLKGLIEAQLDSPRVYRLDEIEVQVFILGLSSCGDVVGLRTTSIET